MAIPDKPLEVNIEVKSLTLGELKLFSKQGFDFYKLSQFLEQHTNWTPDEIEAITLDELEDVAKQLGEAIQRAAVPLPSSGR